MRAARAAGRAGPDRHLGGFQLSWEDQRDHGKDGHRRGLNRRSGRHPPRRHAGTVGPYYAPSTLGSFQREFTFGMCASSAPRRGGFWSTWPVRRCCCPARSRSHMWTWIRCCAGSTGRPSRAPGSTTAARRPDVDPLLMWTRLLRRVYGKRRRAAGWGTPPRSGLSGAAAGLSPLVATLSTPVVAPVIAATRPRGGFDPGCRVAWSPRRWAPPARPARPGRSLLCGGSAFYTPTRPNHNEIISNSSNDHRKLAGGSRLS